MVIFGANSGLDGVSWCISWLQIPGTCPDPPNARIQTKISTVVCCRSVRDHGLLGGCWCQKTPRSGSLLACRYMVLTNTEIAPLPAPILRSACPLHPSGSPNSRAPPARAPRHIPKPPPTHIPTSPTVPIRVYGVDKHRNSTPPSPSCSQHVPCTPLPRSSCSCSLAARPSPQGPRPRPQRGGSITVQPIRVKNPNIPL